MQSSRRYLQLSAVGFALAVWSCGQGEIEEYTAPKTDFSSSATIPGQVGHSHPQAAEVPEWDLPSDWSAHAGSGLRFATLKLDDQAPAVELRVTPLALTAGDPLSNINRWASQIGLPPYNAGQLGSVMHEIESNGHTVRMVNLTGPPTGADPAQQVLAAIIPAKRNAWFFMIMGDSERVSPYEGDFDAFVRTVRFATVEDDAASSEGDASMAGGSVPVSSPGSPDEQMTWQLPENWVEQPNTSNMRVATIAANVGNESAEITITKFPGNVGGMLPNINRWRRQLGMTAVTSLSDQPLTGVEVAGAPAQFLDLLSDPASPGAKRMYVVTVARRDMTWFLKMTGPASFLDSQKTAYDAFVASIGFAGGTPGD